MARRPRAAVVLGFVLLAGLLVLAGAIVWPVLRELTLTPAVRAEADAELERARDRFAGQLHS